MSLRGSEVTSSAMELQLDEQEAETLREILNRVWREARYEISDTDNSSYKRGLRERNAQLKAILDRLGGPLDD